MSEETNWQLELEEYVQQGEPEKAEKSEIWQTAIGLQDVDGLKISTYLLDTARGHIEGELSINEAQKRIQTYYEQRTNRTAPQDETMEADIVASKIAMLLGERTFSFSPIEYQTIHRRLFETIYHHAGQLRPYNITKKEWVLGGDTVTYAAYDNIKDTLEYDFHTERQFSYKNMSLSDTIKHLAKFTSDIWQIHPYCEGNTRATAVFMIKYMKTFGLEVTNDVFAQHSWYFRNALVRANYTNFKNGIHATNKYLELFFSNLLMDTKHDLKNRYLHVNYTPELKIRESQSETSYVSKGNNFTLTPALNFTLDELAILKLISSNPSITQKEIAEKIGKTDRTVKSRMAILQDKHYIRRVNGKRNGTWEILININEVQDEY